MASTVYNEESIALQDGKEVTLRPLPIGRLRRFMKAFEPFAEVKSDEDGFKVFVNCAGIAIEHEFKGQFDSLKAPVSEQEKGEFLSEEYKEYLEEVLDLDTIYKIIEICGGMKLNDPKLMEAAVEAAMAQDAAQDGTN